MTPDWEGHRKRRDGGHRAYAADRPLGRVGKAVAAVSEPVDDMDDAGDTNSPSPAIESGGGTEDGKVEPFGAASGDRLGDFAMISAFPPAALEGDGAMYPAKATIAAEDEHRVPGE